MKWLTIDELREWCHEDEGSEEDVMLTSLGTATELKIAQFLNRPVVASEADIKEGSNAIVANELIKLAAKQMVSHLNEHREAVTEAKVQELPFGFSFLLNDYRGTA